MMSYGESYNSDDQSAGENRYQSLADMPSFDEHMESMEGGGGSEDEYGGEDEYWAEDEDWAEDEPEEEREDDGFDYDADLYEYGPDDGERNLYNLNKNLEYRLNKYRMENLEGEKAEQAAQIVRMYELSSELYNNFPHPDAQILDELEYAEEQDPEGVKKIYNFIYQGCNNYNVNVEDAERLLENKDDKTYGYLTRPEDRATCDIQAVYPGKIERLLDDAKDEEEEIDIASRVLRMPYDMSERTEQDLDRLAEWIQESADRLTQSWEEAKATLNVDFSKMPQEED